MEFLVKTTKREEMIDITEKVNKEIKKYNEGVAHIFVLHTTAAITINESIDSNVPQDILNFLEKLVPKNGKWTHNRNDDNGDAHIKSSLMGNSVSLPIKNGKLQLGKWQKILFCEFDGPRTRNVVIKVTKSQK